MSQNKLGDILPSHNKATEEEFQNFMHRVNEVESIVKKLSSSKLDEQEQGKLLADKFLNVKSEVDISHINEDVELKVKSSRTIINKNLKDDEKSPNEMSKDMFMKSVEKDAKERYQNKKISNERAETYKKIGNNAFKEGNYEKAITYFNKALEQRKDSTVLWNNRALSYIKLGLYEKALEDCEWALKIDESNLKALLNSAKCHKLIKNEDKCKEYLHTAKELNPRYLSFIQEYEENLYTKFEDSN